MTNKDLVCKVVDNHFIAEDGCNVYLEKCAIAKIEGTDEDIPFVGLNSLVGHYNVDLTWKPDRRKFLFYMNTMSVFYLLDRRDKFIEVKCPECEKIYKITREDYIDALSKPEKESV